MLISKRHLDLFKPDSFILLEQRMYSLSMTKEEKEAKGITVFLSHKHDDKDVLKQVISLLKSLGVTTYLDWLDEEMPTNTSGETAERIKDKIIDNKKFILLATEQAIASKWCNWELGFGDAKKYYRHIAIMPITENDGSWKGNEYLQIYPIIKSKYETFKGDYFVEYKNHTISLVDWLKS